MKRLLLIVLFLSSLIFSGKSQEQSEQDPIKKDPPKGMNAVQQRQRQGQIKSVPMNDKTMQAIRHQNQRANMEQMQTINKALRKSMRVQKRK